jgi:hypothetical protein
MTFEKPLKNLFKLYMDRFIKKLVQLIETHLDRFNEEESRKQRRTKHPRSDRHSDRREHPLYRSKHREHHHSLDHHSDHRSEHREHHHYDHHCETIEPCHRDHIIEKIQTVASHLQTKIAENTANKMSDYFTEDACGHLVPIMVRIKTGEQIIQIPKYTLVNHSNIDLKEMKCRFRTNAHNLGIDCPDNFGIETEVVFERNGSVDGYNRISELLIREYT